MAPPAKVGSWPGHAARQDRDAEQSAPIDGIAGAQWYPSLHDLVNVTHRSSVRRVVGGDQQTGQASKNRQWQRATTDGLDWSHATHFAGFVRSYLGTVYLFDGGLHLP